jgi:NAD(P)-dependent dehydrogenase (short-subunit alcohol dehydrogenase family)
VLITGGASGIGQALVELFADQGARVIYLDSDSAAGTALESSLRAQCPEGSAPVFLPCDVTETDRLRARIDEAVQRLGGLDVLVNNAANDQRHPYQDLSPEDWDRCLAVNLKHQFFATQAAAPALIAAGGGAVICLGSIAWLNGTTGMIAYTTAKAGVQGLVRSFARLLGPHHIRVNALLPGWTMTQRQVTHWIDAEAERQIEAAQCLPDRVMPQDVARMALFLASDDAALCTQQSFIVDGGWV